MKINSILFVVLLAFLSMSLGDDEACYDPNCTSCPSDPSTCYACKPGTSLGNSDCIVCTGSNCASCTYDYDTYVDTCQSCLANYAFDSDSTTCSKCADGTFSADYNSLATCKGTLFSSTL